MSDLDPELRELLCCPRCRKPLRDVPRGLLCSHDRVVWPIVDGVPYLVEERVLRATEQELETP